MICNGCIRQYGVVVVVFGEQLLGYPPKCTQNFPSREKFFVGFVWFRWRRDVVFVCPKETLNGLGRYIHLYMSDWFILGKCMVNIIYHVLSVWVVFGLHRFPNRVIIFFKRHQNRGHHGGLVRELDILSRSTLDVDFGIPFFFPGWNLKIISSALPKTNTKPWRSFLQSESSHLPQLLPSKWPPLITGKNWRSPTNPEKLTWAMKKHPGWLGYVGDYTSQLYRDYNKPL